MEEPEKCQSTSPGSYFGHESFLEMIWRRGLWLSRPDERLPVAGLRLPSPYEDYLRILKEAGSGHLSHVSRQIELLTESSTIHTSGSWCFPEHVIEARFSTDDILLELNLAFGGKLLFDGIVRYSNGKQV